MTPTIADIQVHGMTRSAFIARSALAAGAIYGASATSALGHAEYGAFSGGDAGIVTFALTLERIEAEFYKQALAVKTLRPEARKLLELIAKQETEHVRSLNQSVTQLGGKPGPAPQTRFPAITDEASVLRVAIQLEDAGVAVYNGAASQLESPDLLQTAASIAGAEGRHAGALRELAGEFPTLGPFDKVLSGEQADEAVHRVTVS